MREVRKIEPKQIRIIWARAREYGLNDDAVHDLIYALCQKESMKELTYVEAAKVIAGIEGKKLQKRTDEGGRPETVALRRKIYRLTDELGWNNDNERINGFVKRMFKIDRLEWLDEWQCHKLIEILKNMI